MLILAALILLSLFFIPLNVKPSGQTRMILDHTLQVYVSPPCFNEAKLTNNIAESTLAKARELQYEADAKCTTDSLSGQKMSIMDAILSSLGAIKGPWDW
ncbi:hypothetical protein [Paenibacillus ihumii]|uniref:hypothetical protein n=1 Tax=Paenibacillus ihumii TaxID=687436 RepID=UPI0006D81CBE|nr:hypothetical protein [Paenibacillus ihumii]